MSETEETYYLISLNYEGVDYKVKVPDLETAELLLNDSQAAFQYMENLLNISTLNPEMTTARTLDEASPSTSRKSMISDNISSDRIWTMTTAVTHEEASSASTSTSREEMVSDNSSDIIWTRKKPTEKDIEATRLLLATREEMRNLFDDKKTRKAKLWHDIAHRLEENNFILGEKGDERCRQKFSNLQKGYLAYIKHQTTTGSDGNLKEPPFFEEMHSILGGKHKVTPINLEDSMDMDQETSHQNILDNPSQPEEKESVPLSDNQNINAPSTSKEYSQRFKKGSRTVKPTNKLDDLLKEIQKDRSNRMEDFEFFKKYLKKSEQQKDRFLDILQDAFNSRKKTKEESSDSQ